MHSLVRGIILSAAAHHFAIKRSLETAAAFRQKGARESTTPQVICLACEVTEKHGSSALMMFATLLMMTLIRGGVTMHSLQSSYRFREASRGAHLVKG